ncbi:MAG TPA: hypothetical protein VGG62_06880 [Terracidiphilus sp.]|jgi:hypothetical protein
MRLAPVLGFALLVGVLPSLGQKPTPEDLQFRAWERNAGASTCPLDMHVRQGIGSKMMAVDKHGAQQEMFAARLKLLLKDLRPDKSAQRMVQATVTVHGLNGAEQIVPTNAHSDRSGEAVKTLTVRLTPEGEPEVSGDLRLPGFTATLMVDLDSVTYDDGAVVKFSGASACHAPPDMVMLVSR